MDIKDVKEKIYLQEELIVYELKKEDVCIKFPLKKLPKDLIFALNEIEEIVLARGRQKV